MSGVKGALAMARSVRSGSVSRSSSASSDACSRALCRACRSSRLLRASIAAMSCAAFHKVEAWRGRLSGNGVRACKPSCCCPAHGL